VWGLKKNPEQTGFGLFKMEKSKNVKVNVEALKKSSCAPRFYSDYL